MLSIFFDFFGELRKKEVFYVNWKGHIFIEDHLNGEGDVDLFVPLIDKAKFEKLHQINRRTSARITSQDFDPNTAGPANPEWMEFKPLR